MLVYLSGPITGHSYDGVTDWRETFSTQLKDLGHIGVSPMRGKEFLKGDTNISDAYESNPLASAKGIFGRDVFDLRQSEAMVVNFLDCGPRVSIGSVMEIMLAWEIGKYVVVIMGQDNVHNHSFVRECASLIVETEEEAMHVLATVGMVYPS